MDSFIFRHNDMKMRREEKWREGVSLHIETGGQIHSGIRIS